MSSPAVFKILPTTQKYDWGKLGLNSKVAQFISQPELEEPLTIDEKSPYAEVSLTLVLMKCILLLISCGWALIRNRPRV